MPTSISSVLTVGEVAKGVALLTADRKKKALTSWLNGLRVGFADRIHTGGTRGFLWTTRSRRSIVFAESGRGRGVFPAPPGDPSPRGGGHPRVAAYRMINLMGSMRFPCVRPALAGLALCFAVGAAGCSGGSADSATRLSVQETDQQVLQKSAEARKKKAQEKAKLPRSKQKSFD